MKKRKLFTFLMTLLAMFLLASCSQSDDATKNDLQKTEAITENSKSTAKYTIIFDTDGGSSISSQIIEKNGKVVKPSDPYKEGYTFAGWYMTKFYIFEYDFMDKVTSDMTIYAKWEEIPRVSKYEMGTPSIDFWTNSIKTRWMKIAVPITNVGETNLYLGSISIDIEDASGKLIQTVSYISGYPEYIKPGETGYYYDETTCDFTETNVKVVPNLQIKKGINDMIRYDVVDVSINTDTYSGIKIIGRVQNNTNEKGTLVKVVANLFDKNGKLICNCYTYLDNNLEAGSKASFSTTPFSFKDIKPEDVASYEIYAYPYQLNW